MLLFSRFTLGISITYKIVCMSFDLTGDPMCRDAYVRYARYINFCRFLLPTAALPPAGALYYCSLLCNPPNKKHQINPVWEK